MSSPNGDPISALSKALDAFTATQDAVIAAAKKIKDPAPVSEPPVDITREGGMGNAVSSRY